jgi:hypothetical protein
VRRVSLVFAVACAAFLASAGSARASAETVTVDQQLPLAGFQVYVPCTDDVITFTQGTLHDVFHVTMNDLRFSNSVQDQPENATGADTGGRQYIAAGVTREHDAGEISGGQTVITFVSSFSMVGVGAAPSFRTHETIHETITASGQVSVATDKMWATCD